jgi:hypothetical protein
VWEREMEPEETRRDRLFGFGNDERRSRKYWNKIKRGHERGIIRNRGYWSFRLISWHESPRRPFKVFWRMKMWSTQSSVLSEVKYGLWIDRIEQLEPKRSHIPCW